MRMIKRVYLSEQVLDSIMSYIHEHKLSIGDRIPTEGEFAQLFQVSRTSVREAIKALSINGAVESIPGKGTFIRAPIMDVILNRSSELDQIIKAQNSITEIMEVRTALELLAAELAIERGNDEGIALVAEAMEKLRSAVEAGMPWGEAGSMFHSRVAEMSGNLFLVNTLKTLSTTLARYKTALNEADTDMEAHLAAHEAILDALRRRDKKAIRKSVSAHMADTERDLQRLVNKNSATTFIEK